MPPTTTDAQLQTSHPPIVSPSKEAPPYKDDHDEPQAPQRPVLFQQQVPVDPDGGPPVLLAVVPQPAADLAHALEAVAPVQQVLDVLVHDLCDVAQLVVELVEVLGGAGVAVGALGLGDEAVELHEGVGPQGRAEELLRRVGGGELGGQVGQVGEGQLARVGPLRYAEVDDVAGDEVVDRVVARLDAGLGLRVAVQAAEDEFYLGFDLGDGGLGLGGGACAIRWVVVKG